MARAGLDKSEVKKARELLLSQGRYPSADAVRVVLGNTGSKTTIHKYLKELDQETGKAGDLQAQTARTLQDFIEDFAAKLRVQTDTHLEQVRTEYEAALRRNAEEIGALQKQVENLNFRLRQAQSTVRDVERSVESAYAFYMESQQLPGFGNFNELNNNRNGKPGWSSFNLAFDDRSSVHVDNHISQPGYEILSRI